MRAAAERAAAYLMLPEHRPMGASFLCRTAPQRDFCNGLIGQAWAIEALSVAADGLGAPQHGALARELFLRHDFHERTGLWRCLNVEGSYGPFDMTFNHQLWFAASGALAATAPQDEVGRRVLRFLDCTHAYHLKVDPSGRINHFVPSTASQSRARQALSAVAQPFKRLRRKPHMVSKEIGYHAFNLYAFALLHSRFPTHPLWANPRLLAALRFVSSDAYVRGLENNRFGYPYNPPGFEVAFAVQSFPAAASGANPAWWVTQQLRHTYDPDTGLIHRQTDDQQTLAARLYEATRLHDLELDLALLGPEIGRKLVASVDSMPGS